MFRSSLQTFAFILLSLPLLLDAPASAQEVSAIGELLLNIRTQDGRPVVGTPVVVKRQGDARAEVVGTTDASGTARVPAGTFEAEAPIRATLGARFGTSIRDRIERQSEEEFQKALDAALTGRLDPELYTPTATTTLPRNSEYEWALNVPFVALSDDPSVGCESTRFTKSGDWASGCGSSNAVPWGTGNRYEFEFDTGCDAEGPNGRVTGRITGGYLFPTGSDTADDDPRPDREADFFRPLLLQFPDDLGRTSVQLPPGCEARPDETDLPETGLFLLHGYNIDFGDGSWGIRGRTSLPVLPEYPLGFEAGLDYYPQNDSRSTTAINLDLSYHLPWEALGEATAYGGGGLRAYIQTFSGASSSSRTEIGFGLVSGMTYPIGPIDVYGDVGLDRVYGAFVPVTHFGVGYVLRE